MRIGVVTFPGSLDEVDAARAVRLAGGEPVQLWHAEPQLYGVDAVVLPGGFSYGDYLRCGAIARFAPVMTAIAEAVRDGTPVLGICNGFQILCEAGLLPGALTRNQHLRFRRRDQWLQLTSTATAWTNQYHPEQQLLVPIKSGEGCYVADAATLDELESTGRVIARYVGGNPNGSLRDIAAVSNEAGNVVGIMPHPEHAVDPLTGPSTVGLGFFTSVLQQLAEAAPAAAPASGGGAPPAGDPAASDPAASDPAASGRLAAPAPRAAPAESGTADAGYPEPAYAHSPGPGPHAAEPEEPAAQAIPTAPSAVTGGAG